MVDHSKPLTKEQQQLAEEYHGLIYSFLNAYRLKESEFYDVVVFGYLNAVRIYTERPEVQEWSFKTIAFKKMLSSLSNECRKTARRIQPLSLDAENEDGFALYTVIAAKEPEEDTGGQYSAQYTAMLKVLTKRQRDALTMKANGYTCGQIGRIFGIPAKTANNLTYKAKAKVLRAEQARSDQLRVRASERAGRCIPLEGFDVLEQTARRRLALYKSRNPQYRRQESALPKIIAELVAEPIAAGGGATVYSPIPERSTP